MRSIARWPRWSTVGIGGVGIAAVVILAGLAAGFFEVGLLAGAALLGVTHAIEPDHVAGIAALTHDAGDPTLSALVGGCFATGHVLLVGIWITVAYALLGTTTFPAIYEQFGVVFVGIVLTALGLYLGASGTRRLVHHHVHEHDGDRHAHLHLHWPTGLGSSDDDHGGIEIGHGGAEVGQDANDIDHDDEIGHTDSHAHDHGILGYLKIGTIGALFTLSPPVSMIVFVSTAMNHGGPIVVGAVLAYAVSIVAAMAAIGGGAGSAFRFTQARGRRVHAASQVVAAVVVLVIASHLLLDAAPALLA
ncbi:MAG: hypothetical protein ABEJ86_01480 [Halococcoides sp.]